MDQFDSFFAKRGRSEGFGSENRRDVGRLLGFLLEHKKCIISFGFNKIFETADNTKSVDDASDTKSDTKRGEKST